MEVDGVRAGHFALAEGTSSEDAKVLHYKDTIATSAIFLEDGYLLLRQALADTKLVGEEERKRQQTPVTPTTGGSTAGTTATIAHPWSPLSTAGLTPA